jgi:hypothetical protein
LTALIGSVGFVLLNMASGALRQKMRHVRGGEIALVPLL